MMTLNLTQKPTLSLGGVAHASNANSAPRLSARHAAASTGSKNSLSVSRPPNGTMVVRAHSQRGASCSSGASTGTSAEALSFPEQTRPVRLTRTIIHEVCSQVEAEWGDEAAEVVLTDPLLIALEARKKVLKAEKGETRFVQMAKRSVELASTMALGAPLVSELAADSIAQLVATNEETLQSMLALHGPESQALIVEHMDKVAYETDPIEVGNFQMRMPPMVGHGDIAIPHVFLSQVYSKSVAFGYALASAQERKELEETLRASMDGDAYSLQVPSMAAYLYGRGSRSSILTMPDCLAKQVADDQTHRLFGQPMKLVLEVDRAMRFAKSPEEAQESLDNAMCNGGIPWLRVPASGLRRLMAEALAFGRILCAVEHSLPAQE